MAPTRTAIHEDAMLSSGVVEFQSATCGSGLSLQVTDYSEAYAHSAGEGKQEAFQWTGGHSRSACACEGWLSRAFLGAPVGISFRSLEASVLRSVEAVSWALLGPCKLTMRHCSMLVVVCGLVVTFFNRCVLPRPSWAHASLG